ncbi:MAG: serine protease [Bacteroidota bacterium]
MAELSASDKLCEEGKQLCAWETKKVIQEQEVRGSVLKTQPAVVEIQCKINPEGSSSTYSGQGSGVLISKDGYIITNSHCIFPDKYNPAIVVTVYEDTIVGREYKAKLVRRNKELDLALLKLQEVQQNKLPYLEFVDSDMISYDKQLMVMVGRVSGTYTSSAGYCYGGSTPKTSPLNSNFLYFTYINFPGNSGGAVVTGKHPRLVAINKGISGYEMGLYSVAIPAHTVKKFIQKHIPQLPE